ncbi:MAG: tRNA (N(6)-L-threonylcarbamoyladenosine(37)-C(2))-methylthiotransferase MtaB [Lachnospiraceae bacterium]|nr:tRNA (N(6)-L-threonylcarbamoyladenosine(37)-C(2))-methylthiotransferase MtaB [Lachnospiraceae bacterium]MDY5699505.1 tRNA (N(6)-L-threonylcarbamoyladenosine(37)-C(2))-methylthiotransferase MtaB [Lachnospiraceae bacterium]
MKNVALHNLGCKVNSYEIEVMQEKLEEKGYRIVPFASGADIYIINTCTVTNIADRKSRQMLHKAKKMNPQAVVVAVGCYVQTGTEEIKKDPCIDLAIGNNRKKDIVPLLEEYLRQRGEVFLPEATGAAAQGEEENKVLPDKTLGNTTLVDLNGSRQEYEEMTLTHTGEHTRAYIKIQDGCNQFCSYCIIPFARGRVRSRRPEDIIKEVEGLARAGYREVVVTGIHLSSYGLDFEEGKFGDYLATRELRDKTYKKGYLLEVLEKINRIEGIERIRLGSLEPRIVTDDFVKRLLRLDKLCPHFHLSLQSGCDTTLKRMNRHYTTEEFQRTVERLRAAYEKPAITTDVIVGFPGETEEEFETTCRFLEEIKFYDMHIFKYSKRQGTAAAARTDQVAEQVKTIRSNRLLKMAARHSEEYCREFLGKNIEALIEEKREIEGRPFQVGLTPAYVKVAVEAGENLSNRIIRGKATGLLADEYLFLEIGNQD